VIDIKINPFPLQPLHGLDLIFEKFPDKNGGGGYHKGTTVADQRVSQLNLSSPRNIPIRSGYQVAQRRTTAIFVWKFFKN
jgi:hypothetical protein